MHKSLFKACLYILFKEGSQEYIIVDLNLCCLKMWVGTFRCNTCMWVLLMACFWSGHALFAGTYLSEYLQILRYMYHEEFKEITRDCLRQHSLFFSFVKIDKRCKVNAWPRVFTSFFEEKWSAYTSFGLMLICLLFTMGSTLEEKNTLRGAYSFLWVCPLNKKANVKKELYPLKESILIHLKAGKTIITLFICNNVRFPTTQIKMILSRRGSEPRLSSHLILLADNIVCVWQVDFSLWEAVILSLVFV